MELGKLVGQVMKANRECGEEMDMCPEDDCLSMIVESSEKEIGEMLAPEGWNYEQFCEAVVARTNSKWAFRHL